MDVTIAKSYGNACHGVVQELLVIAVFAEEHGENIDPHFVLDFRTLIMKRGLQGRRILI